MPGNKSGDDLRELRNDPPDARPVGLLQGRIRMAKDFDETPDDLIDLMEGIGEPLQ